eukprot:682340-Pleurochrysis_carterae.AAC.1
MHDENGRLPLPLCAGVIIGVSRAIHAIHSGGVSRQGVIVKRNRGDVKLENIVIVDNVVKLIDFEFSFIDGRKPSCTGSLSYMSPELFTTPNTETIDGYADDMWALGIVMFALFAGMRTPWNYAASSDAMFSSAKVLGIENYLRSLCVASNVDPNVIDIICCLLREHPVDRINAKQARSCIEAAVREMRGIE